MTDPWQNSGENRVILYAGCTKEIDAEVKIFDSEDEITKCLIETNIRQRGIGNTNPVKFGRCLDELKRIYGVYRGNHVNENPNNSDSKTQEEIASSIGISVDTMENYIKVSKAIPEIQTLLETGIVTPTTARAIIKKLPEFQQKEIADKFASEGIKVPLHIVLPVIYPLILSRDSVTI